MNQKQRLFTKKKKKQSTQPLINPETQKHIQTYSETHKQKNTIIQ